MTPRPHSPHGRPWEGNKGHSIFGDGTPTPPHPPHGMPWEGSKGHSIFQDGAPTSPTPRNALHTHWQMTSGPCTAGPAPTPSSLPSPERNAASTMGSWGRQKTRDSITFPHLEGAVPIEEATKGPQMRQTDLSHPQLWVLCKQRREAAVWLQCSACGL